MNDSGKLQAAQYGAHLEECGKRFRRLLNEHDGDQAPATVEAFDREWKAHQEQGLLTVAFVGQYNAGKSTSISALTDRRDIKIASDIATDATASYDWNGIKIIDTPGLFTERQDHDAITYEALRQADLLVYTLTYMLFDSITAANFRKLAFELGFQRKMFLVVNKINCEAGDTDERIKHYRQSLQDALAPHSLDDFPCCFIDAQDYLEGRDDNDEFLVEDSRFGPFIDELNRFIKARGTLGRLDTPARILLGHVEKAQQRWTRADGHDRAYIELLNRLSQRCRQDRQRLRNQVGDLTADLSSQVSRIGAEISREIGGDGDVEASLAETEHTIKQICDDTQERFQELVNAAIQDLRDEFEEVLSGELATDFAVCLAPPGKLAVELPSGNTEDLERVRRQWDRLTEVGNKVGVAVGGMAGKAGVAAKGLKGFLKPAQVAGGDMHNIVFNVGKFLGVKFKPWQAVNLAGKIGNVAKCVGPALSILSAGLEVYQALKEEKIAKKVSRARIDCAAHFRGIGDDLATQFRKQLKEVEAHSFDEIDRNIEKARELHTAELSKATGAEAALEALRGDVTKLIAGLADDEPVQERG